MAMPEPGTGLSWVGRTVVDREGAEIGVCSAVLTDDGTGLPEWLYARVGETTVIIPLVDASESDEHVRVAVSRADAESAPPPAGDTQHLSQDEEAALYRHYGIEYSREASETLLPADASADTATADTSDTDTSDTSDTDASDTAAPETAPSGAGGSSPAGTSSPDRARAAGAGALAGLGLLVAVVLGVRRRRPPPPPARRGAASVGRAVGAAARGARGASVVATERTAALLTAAAPIAAAAGRVAWQGTETGARYALRGAGAATRLAGEGLQRGAAAGLGAVQAAGGAARELGGTVRIVPEVVAETGHRVEKGWRRAMGRVSLGLGFGVGYVLGARAGRARFEQIKQAAAGLAERPQVQEALEKVRSAAPGPLQGMLGGTSGRSSGGVAPATVGLSPDVDPATVVTTPTGSSAPPAPLSADDLPGDEPGVSRYTP